MFAANMDSLILEGTILQKLDAQEGMGARGPWKKQEFIIETSDQYPKKICICCWNEKIDDLSNYNVHDRVRIGINIESREYNQRWYTDIKAWKIEAANVNTGATSPEKASNDIVGMSFTEEEGDLPF